MTATIALDLDAFGRLQRRAELVRIKLRRFEGGGSVRIFAKTRGVSRELHSAVDLEALLADIADLESVNVVKASGKAPAKVAV